MIPTEAWLAVIVVTHGLLVLWAYEKGVEHACDALLQRMKGEHPALEDAVQDLVE